jgi:hypothetical protein
MTLEEIINDWSKEAQAFPYCRTAAVFRILPDKIQIITDRPGLWIGHHGELIFKYQQILKDNGHISKTEFIDIGKGFEIKFLYD